MNRPLTISPSFVVLCAALWSAFSIPVSGQTSPEIESLAGRTAERVAKAHREHVLLAGLQECLLAPDVCASFETTLGAGIEKLVPGVHFIKRENVVNILEGRGFLALDVCFPEVLKAVANSAGADILVTDTLLWQRDGYELFSEVYDVAQNKKLDQFREKIDRPAPDSGGDPVVYTDPESKVSVIINQNKQAQSPAVVSPACEHCPSPVYTLEARADRVQGRVLLLVTITEKGIAENIGVIDGLGDGLSDRAVETVQSWKFKPATGKDGKPFATRMPLEVVFRLQ